MNSKTDYSQSNPKYSFSDSNCQFQNGSTQPTNDHVNQKSMSQSNPRSNVHESSAHTNAGSRNSSKHRSNSNGGGNGSNPRRRLDSNASQQQSPMITSSIGCDGFNSCCSYQQPREYSYDEQEENLDDYENIELPEADYDPVQIDETAPPPSPALGDKTKSGEYKVVKPIGTGASGQVFLVLHVHERRKYVMKQILLDHLAPKDRESTEQEVLLLSGLSHPNITKFKESFVDEKGVLCIVMEYCEHGDLYTYRKKITGKLAENRLTEWTIQIVLALNELHRRSILHRDLKTQNIFLCGAGGGAGPSQYILKLGDFGVAKALDASCKILRF
jgi:tRNA A-37 threonylcarbamoyl transferase component Bud32